MTSRVASPDEARLAEAKRELRHSIQRRRLSANQLRDEGERIATAVSGMKEFIEARLVGLYLAMDQETPTAPLIARCRTEGKQVCVPARKPGGTGYAMVRLDEGTELREAHFGVSEPVKPVGVDEGRIDLMIVPGVAFDMSGRRLGHGKGFYDRMLQTCGGYRIGLALSTRFADRVPVGPRDVPMDAVVTADAVYHAPGGRVREGFQQHNNMNQQDGGRSQRTRRRGR